MRENKKFESAMNTITRETIIISNIIISFPIGGLVVE